MEQVTLDVETRRRDEAQRYSRRNILRSEFMYGRGFQSPGGIEALEGFCARLDLRPGMRALEIGSGLGGSSFHLATRHHLHVVGLDVADAMVEISDERRRQAGIQGVTFVRGDIRTAALDEASFDLAWTRDCVLYVPEKDLVWRQVSRCLKPGGQLFVTDFARGDGPLSPAFRSYVDGCDYHLQTLDGYARTLAAAGLAVTAREDVTADFIAGLEAEKAQLAGRRAAFLREYDLEDYEYLMTRWDQKIAFCRAGELRWGLFVARKA
jgi:phosphoethanolamine N-methyltransferase